MANPATILLRGDLGQNYREKIAAVACLPGYVLAVDNADKFKPFPTAGAKSEMHVAIEDALQGRDIDTQYAIGDLVRAVQLRSGDEFWGFIAAGVSATTDIFLVHNGDGTFKINTGSDTGLVRPKAAVDNSAGGAAVRCKFEVV